MFLIGENLNVMSKKLGQAFLERDAGPIQGMARAQTEDGMDMIDLNIGPARKTGPDFMEWLVTVVQDVTDLPLSLDTSNIEAIETGLKAAKTRPLLYRERPVAGLNVHWSGLIDKGVAVFRKA